MRVTPPARRSIVREGMEGLGIVFPARRNILVLLVIVPWLGGWAMGATVAARQVAFGTLPAGARAFLIFWLALWSFGGGAVIYTGLWMLAGKEIVSLRSSVLAIRRDVFGLGRTREFDLLQVSSLRRGTEGAGWAAARHWR